MTCTASSPVDGPRAFGTAAAETILRSDERTIELLVAREEITVVRGDYAAGLDVAGPHVHHSHTDAFYVLEGTLIFEIGDGPTEVSVTAGGCVAVPPGIPHAFRVDGGARARWLTIHTPDGGFAALMRAIRDGAGAGAVEWDTHPVMPPARIELAHAV